MYEGLYMMQSIALEAHAALLLCQGPTPQTVRPCLTDILVLNVWKRA